MDAFEWVEFLENEFDAMIAAHNPPTASVVSALELILMRYREDLRAQQDDE